MNCAYCDVPGLCPCDPAYPGSVRVRVRDRQLILPPPGELVAGFLIRPDDLTRCRQTALRPLSERYRMTSAQVEGY